MTPQERALVTELFDRLAKLEAARRDPDAERLIADGLARAPNATYALVQMVLLQDEALNRAQARIEELEREASTAASGGSFLDNLRGGFGRGSVPSVAAGSKWNNSPSAPASGAPPSNAPPLAQPAFGQGGSFLGTAAAAAVGVIGGSMLFNGLRDMMGSANAQSFGSTGDGADRRSPWENDAARGELARDAGVNDIGAGRGSHGDNYGDDRGAGLFDSPSDGDDLFADSGVDFDGGDF